MDNTFHGFHTLKFFAGFNFDTKLRTDNKKQYFSIVVSIQKYCFCASSSVENII